MKNLGRIYNVVILGLIVIIVLLGFITYYYKAQSLESNKKYLKVNKLTNALITQNRKFNIKLANKIDELKNAQADLEQMARAAESNASTVKLLYYEIEQGKEKIAVLEKTAARQRKGLGIFDDFYKKKIATLQEKVALCTQANQQLAQDGTEQAAIIAEKDKKLLFCTQANDKLLSENSKRQKMITELEDKLQKKNPETISVKAPFALYYDLNKWNIRGEEQAENLKHNIKWMLNNWEYALTNGLQFYIIGYCSHEGTPIYNWGIVGSKRALSVEQTFIKALKKAGATEDEINNLLRPLSAGKYRPEYKKPKNNRRVEIYLVKNFQN